MNEQQQFFNAQYMEMLIDRALREEEARQAAQGSPNRLLRNDWRRSMPLSAANPNTAMLDPRTR